jgi:hypothetical protein
MRYPASEKAEIIQLVEQSHLPAKRTLDKLSIPRVDFDLICLARCKHLSGVTRSDQGAQMGNPLAPASTAGRPRGPR